MSDIPDAVKSLARPILRELFCGFLRKKSAGIKKRKGDQMENQLPQIRAQVKLYHDSNGKSEILGFADLTIASAFVIRGVRIIMAKGKVGQAPVPFLSFPARKGSGASAERYFEVAFPASAEARRAATEVVLKAYAAATQSAA
jgi:DNA-binding cell septation regulator SpoVG